MATNKPANISSKIWASLGDVETPTDAKMETGWVAEVPKAQVENWVQNRQDAFNAHVNERGIAEWDATTDYIAGKSYVQGSNGIVYVANQNTGPSTTPQDPTTDNTNTYWRVAFQDKLVSGSNIKTINGSPVLGGGNLVITGSSSEASNIGSGEGVFAGKDGDDLQFKSLVAGDGVSISSDTETITITADGGGGGSQTDLGIGTRTDTTVEVTSSTGSSANLPAATPSLAGVMTADDKVKLNNENITALVGLTGAEDQLPYFTGAGALSLTTLTAAARTLLAATSAAGQRSALGLGTAATRDVGTSTGNLLSVGEAFGLGANVPTFVVELQSAPLTVGTGFYGGTAGKVGSPGGLGSNSWGVLSHRRTGTYATQMFEAADSNRVFFRRYSSGAWGPWVEFLHSGNQLSLGTTAASARTALGLGTAATAVLATSTTDKTMGRVLRIGDHGLGLSSEAPATLSDIDSMGEWSAGSYRTIDGVTAGSLPGAYGSVLRWGGGIGIPDGEWLVDLFASTDGNIFFRTKANFTPFSPWNELYHYGNISTASVAHANTVNNATSTSVGGLKVRLDGTTLYMTNDGSDA